MQKFRRTLVICGALTLAATAWRCDSNGSSGTNPDLSSPTADMATGGGGDMATSAAPTITSIKPGVGTNAGGTSITITGTGFQSGATVTIAGTQCSQVVVAADGNSLTCTTPAKAKTCGSVATVVTNPDNQTASSNAFAYTTKQFGFGTAANVANNNNPSRSVVWADFDLDGKNDIANLNGMAANPSANLSVQLGKGDGTFQATKGTDLGMGNTGAALAAGDMNNDKVPDLVVLVSPATNPRVLVMLGQKDGTFKAAVGSPVKLTANTNPTSIAIGADDKTKPYVVVAGTTANKASVDVLTNDGTGALTLGAPNVFGAANSAGSALALADVTGDGKLDLLVVNQQTAGNVYGLSGDGKGGFTAIAGSPYTMGTNPIRIVATDLDGDGLVDLVTANAGQNGGIGAGLSTRKGDGKGGFGNAATAIPLTTAPVDLTVADLNVDGIPDIAVAHAGGGLLGNTFSYLLGKAGLTYNAAVTVAVNNGSDSIIAAPFNTLNDGNPDVVTTSTTVNLSIVLNQCQ